MSNTSQPAGRPARRWTLLVWSVVGLVASFVLVGVAYNRLQPKVVTREVTVPALVYEQREKLMEVKTADGKVVKAYVPVQTAEIVERTQTVQGTREPTPEQSLRLWIIRGAAVLLGLFFLAVVVVFLFLTVRGTREPPKELGDWVKYLMSGIVGAVLGFLGAPMQ